MKRTLTRTPIVYHIVNGRMIEGPPAEVTGDLTDIRGDLSGVRGDLDECGLTADDRASGVDIKALIEGGGDD